MIIAHLFIKKINSLSTKNRSVLFARNEKFSILKMLGAQLVITRILFDSYNGWIFCFSGLGVGRHRRFTGKWLSKKLFSGDRFHLLERPVAGKNVLPKGSVCVPKGLPMKVSCSGQVLSAYIAWNHGMACFFYPWKTSGKEPSKSSSYFQK